MPADLIKPQRGAVHKRSRAARESVSRCVHCQSAEDVSNGHRQKRSDIFQFGRLDEQLVS
jgi:hypothetical protein